MTVRSFLLSAAIAAVAVAGAPAWAQVKTSFGPTTTDISTGHAGHSSLPTELGYWKEEGLDVNVFGVKGSIAGVQLLAAGNIDFISLNPEELIAAQQRGVPIKGVYMHARTPIARLVVPKTAGVKSLTELKGKTLGIPVINAMSYAKLTFEEAGVDLANEIKVVATGTGAPALIALQRGDIAGWISWDTAVAGLENRGMEFDEFRPSFFDEMIGNVVVAREETIKNSPDLVVKMTRGIAKAVHFGLANPDAAIAIHWKLYPQTKPQGDDEKALLSDAKRVFVSRFQSYGLNGVDKYGESLKAQWVRTATLMTKVDLLPKDADIEKIAAAAYTNEFVDEINKWDRAAIEAQAKAWTMN